MVESGQQSLLIVSSQSIEVIWTCSFHALWPTVRVATPLGLRVDQFNGTGTPDDRPSRCWDWVRLPTVRRIHQLLMSCTSSRDHWNRHAPLYANDHAVVLEQLFLPTRASSSCHVRNSTCCCGMCSALFAEVVLSLVGVGQSSCTACRFGAAVSSLDLMPEWKSCGGGLDSADRPVHRQIPLKGKGDGHRFAGDVASIQHLDK